MSTTRWTLKQLSASLRPWRDPVVLLILVVGAFLLRTVGQVEHIFVGDNVWFRGTDSWYHMRLADAMIANFPQHLRIDQYSLYPGGTGVGYMPMLSWLVALFGSVYDYEVVAAYIPPVLGALTLIPVYFLGREIRNGTVGLLAAFMVALIPGELLHRTLLGFTDHHALEIFLMPSIIFCLMRAYKSMSWPWAVAAGVLLGAYQLSWAGASLALLVLGTWFSIEFLRRLRDREDIKSLWIPVSLPVAIGIAMSYWYVSGASKIISFGLMIAPMLLWGLTTVARKRVLILAGFVILVGLGLAVGSFYISWQAMFLTLFWRGESTVQEGSLLTLPIVFQIYGIAAFAALLGLWLLPRNRYNSLFIMWAALLLVMGTAQKRWGYYATIPVSLLSAYLAVYTTKWIVPTARVAVILVIVAFFVLPNIRTTLRISEMRNNIDANWYVALTWLEKNSPEPFTSENSYLDTDLKEQARYGVLTWWDYGHWVIRIAKRVPTDSPTQVSGLDSRFFTALTEEEAIEELNNSPIYYAIVDTTLITAKWYAVSKRGGRPGMDVTQSQAWRLWTNQSPNWVQVFERGDVRIYARSYQ